MPCRGGSPPHPSFRKGLTALEWPEEVRSRAQSRHLLHVSTRGQSETHGRRACVSCGKHVWTLWPEVDTCCPLDLWADVRLPHDGRSDATLLAAILQDLALPGDPCVADGMGRLALAAPPASGPPPARVPPRIPHASTPLHTPGARDPHGLLNAALCCTHVVAPMGCPSVHASRPAHDTLRRPCSPAQWGVSMPQPAAQRSFWNPWTVCTYWRRPLVPTGDA